MQQKDCWWLHANNHSQVNFHRVRFLEKSKKNNISVCNSITFFLLSTSWSISIHWAILCNTASKHLTPKKLQKLKHMPKIKGIESHDFKQKKKIWFFLQMCVYRFKKKQPRVENRNCINYKRHYKLVKSFWNAVWWSSEQLIF